MAHCMYWLILTDHFIYDSVIIKKNISPRNFSNIETMRAVCDLRIDIIVSILVSDERIADYGRFERIERLS